MNQRTISEEAERLSMRRARALPALGIIFLAQQASFLSMPEHAVRPVDHLKVSAWLVLTIVLLAGLATGGGWFRSRAVRDLLNDESTRAHRQTGYVYGFWAAMGTALGIYIVNMITTPRACPSFSVDCGFLLTNTSSTAAVSGRWSEMSASSWSARCESRRGSSAELSVLS